MGGGGGGVEFPIAENYKYKLINMGGYSINCDSWQHHLTEAHSKCLMYKSMCILKNWVEGVH